MRIAVVGAGGVGGYFGGRLAEAGVDVAFVARGAHLEAMRVNGLRIRSPKGDAHVRVTASAEPKDIGPVDVVLFTVKLYDTEAALGLLPPLVGPQTVVLPLQNGVDGVDIVMRAVGPAHTAGGTCYVSAMIAEPGVIVHTAMEQLIFGELDGTRSARLERLLQACAGANFQSTLSPNITEDIWSKFTRLSVLSGMNSVTRSPLGIIVRDPDLFTMLKDAVAEAVAVANAKGIPLGRNMVEDVARAYQALPPHTKASMLVDLEHGRRLELPWLSGAVVRIGRETGVPTPIHAFIATVLKPHVNGAP
ncbi:MAG TPA: 2-dehydropantoate 2-reductase [Vicinamibacterales bacterium]|jgi:2-dehydropantoate 2-reductase|nr:2-dehydropantoate 2-reductase [Vicinamibacterales bacterium]